MKKILFLFLFLFFTQSVFAGVRGQLRQGGKFYNDQKYGSALNHYNEVLKKHPHHQPALFNAGNAYYRLHEYTQAEEVYKKAAQTDGDYSQSALFNLGNTYYKAGKKEEAKKAFQAAIVKNPADKEAVHNLQLILQEEQEQKQDNQQNNNDNQQQNSDNQSQQNQDQNSQAPEQQNDSQEQQGQLSKSDADRIMSMARENEHKAPSASRGRPEKPVEKDW